MGEVGEPGGAFYDAGAYRRDLLQLRRWSRLAEQMKMSNTCGIVQVRRVQAYIESIHLTQLLLTLKRKPPWDDILVGNPPDHLQCHPGHVPCFVDGHLDFGETCETRSIICKRTVSLLLAGRQQEDASCHAGGLAAHC